MSTVTMNQSTMQKALIYGGITLGVLIVLFYALNAYIYTEKQGDEETITEARIVNLDGVVTAVNLEEMMVDGPARITFTTAQGESHEIALPSMGRLLCAATDTIASPSIVAIGDTVAVRGDQVVDGEIVPCADVTHYFRVTGHVLDYEVAVGFPYRKGPDGYVLTKDIPGMSTNANFVTGYQFMLEKEKVELENATDAREGPPTIELRVYKNTENLDPAVWILRNPLESNSEMMFGEPAETVIGGANAVYYVADGLYAMHTHVVAHGAFVYVFTASTLDDNSPQKVDLDGMLRALSFIPEKG